MLAPRTWYYPDFWVILPCVFSIYLQFIDHIFVIWDITNKDLEHKLLEPGLYDLPSLDNGGIRLRGKKNGEIYY